MTQISVGDDLKIDCAQRKVLVKNQEVAIPERTYRLLLTLVEHAPNIVSHDQLMQTVWPDAVVSDETLKQRISRLRRLLSESGATGDLFIAERGLGYRCTATVTTSQINQQAKADIKNDKNNKATIAVFIVLFLVSIVAITTQQRPSNTTTIDDNELIAPTLTANDYEAQAREYYYRFNPQANDTAIELYHHAIELDANFVLGYAGLSNAHSQGYYQYGKDQQWLQRAKNNAERAIEIDPQQPWGHKALGLALYLQGHYQQSINHYQRASRLATWWASPVNNIALAQMESGKLVSAYNHSIESIKLGPKDPIPYLFLGLIYRDLNMNGHALNAINRAISFKPDYNLAQNYLAEYYLLLGQFEQAKAVLDKNQYKLGYDQFAHWLYGNIYLYQNSHQKAIQHFEQAAKLGGRYQLIAQTYRDILSEGKTKDESFALIQSQITKGNQWFELPYTLALIAANKGQTQQMLHWLEQAVTKGLNHPIRLSNPLLTPSPQIENLTENLKQKIQKQRQTVVQIEQSRDF